MHEIALIGPLESEARLYLEQASDLAEIQDGPFCFLEGTVCGRKVLMANCGTGKVLAALTTQKVIDLCHPKAIIIAGEAAALRPDLHIGDVVISNDCVQHDVDFTVLGLPRGLIPEMKARALRADRRLVSLAMSTKLERHQVVLGRILSGDQFLTAQETKRRAYLIEELQGSAIDVEGTAIACVCQYHAVPFVIARDLC